MAYSPKRAKQWIDITERQKAKDHFLIERIEGYLCPGSILEIGAGCGQLSSILQERGYKVLASDLSPAFVNYMLSQGLPSVLVDALDISKYVNEPMNNILAQGLWTLVTPDLGMVERTYRSCYAALQEGGRLLWVFPNAFGSKKWSNVNQHREIIRTVGFRSVVEFRDQVMPSSWYGFFPRWMVHTLERCFGRFLGIRWVFVLEKHSS